MDGLLDLTIFLAATFASALVAGLSGFAFGLIAASLWLYVISPADCRANHRLRAACTRLFGLETPPRPRLEQALAICDRSGARRSNRCDDLDLGQSCSRSCWRRHLFGPLQPVRAFPSGHKAR